MRQVIRGLGLVGLLLATGCSNMNNRPKGDGVAPQTRWDRQPTTASLVSYLNENARLVQAVRCESLSLEARQGKESPATVEGRLDCQKPRNFRLTGKVIGQPYVDVGSNDTELWFWVRPQSPYLYHCSHEALAQGAVREIPFQPDMILTALGMAEHDPRKQYRINTTTSTVELIEPAVTPQGQQIEKVTVFARAPARNDQPQVLAHILRDAQGRKICEATITHAVRDRMTGVELPRRVALIWPDQHLELRLRLEGIHVVQPNPQESLRLYSRAGLSYPGVDLVTRQKDQPDGFVERVGNPPR
jgi:hypothetical protein